MRQDHRRSGIDIEVPDAYAAPSAAERRRGRRRAADETAPISNFDEVDSAFIDALLREDMVLVDEFEYEADRAQIRSARARSAEEQTLRVSMAAEPGETAVALVEEDGVYSWQFPVEDSGKSRRAVRRDDGPRSLRFDIPLSEAAPGAGTRSVFSTAVDLVGGIKGRILKTGTDQIVRLLERKIERGLVDMSGAGPQHWAHVDDPARLGLPTDRDPRILLFVHGTFSSTLSSFHSLASLAAGNDVLEDMAKRYDAVIGFDHPTLSVDPEQNAIDLIEALQRASDRALVLDAVSYSRGGLVLRSLIETLLPRSDLNASFRKAIFVGATNEGTALAEPDNWRDFIDVYTNLVLGATRAVALTPGAAPIAMVVGSAVKGLGVAVKSLVGQTISGGAIPGLAAMEPDGEFVRMLNSAQRRQDDVDYFAVVSDFEGGAASGGLANELPRKFLMRAADPLVDRLMKGLPNDLVVDTPSMTSTGVAGGHRVRETLDFGRNSVVYHTVYFTQNALGNSFRSWLGLGDGSRRSRRSVPTQQELLGQVDAHLVPSDAFAPTGRTRGKRPEPEQPEGDRPVVNVEVVWDDIGKATGDVYAVGHYEGVMPQRAELALDRIVSDSTVEEDLVLSGLTRSNALRGGLGEISFFPWGGSNKRNRFIAVCGMGNYGPFGADRLRRLYRNLAQSLLTLPDPRTLCSVLIGAGEGAMSTEDAVAQLALGFGDAIRATGRGEQIKRVRIVELYRSNAVKTQEALDQLSRVGGFPVKLRVGPVVAGEYGEVSAETAKTLLVRAASLAGHLPSEPKSFEDIAAHMPSEYGSMVPLPGTEGNGEERPLRLQLRSAWGEAAGDLEALATVTTRGGLIGTEPPRVEPQRITFVHDGGAYRVSAITDNATVPERRIGVQRGLIDEAVAEMTDPLPGDMAELSELLFRLTLPRAFREIMAIRAPTVFEVGGHTASIHWEMLASGIGDERYAPIGLDRPVSRQLRTRYSEALPIGGGARNRRMNALVIGDPGDPDRNENLPHARREARRVAAFLEGLARDRSVGIDVQTLIGAPSNPDRGVPPASRLEVLRRLMRGDIDLVHFAGHADFDPEDQRNTGWLFHDGMLTAGEIERIDRPPSIVVANACLTGRVSTLLAGGATTTGAYADAALLPSLAEEFFNRGVRNYIGTAWEIDDGGAVEFAEAFYTAFFTPANRDQETIGGALLDARRKLHEWEKLQPHDLVLWAAYQHYGDPGFRSGDM